MYQVQEMYQNGSVITVTKIDYEKKLRGKEATLIIWDEIDEVVPLRGLGVVHTPQTKFMDTFQ